MIGGTVCGIARFDAEPTRLHVADGNDRCCVNVQEGADKIRLGDSVWWQAGNVYWTPKPDDGRRDVPLPKVGNSYSAPDPD